MGTDEACNDPCHEVIDANASRDEVIGSTDEQETISEAFGDSKTGDSSEQDREASIEQSVASLHSDNIAKFHVGTRLL